MTESSELTQKQHLFVGQVFEGRFEILSVLGSGGVGVVYKAKHTHMDKVVAIKMLMTQVVSGDDSFKRFEQEARAASTLAHQNIITIHDFGKSVDGHAYLVMEYLHGVSLDDVLKIGGRLDLQQFLRIFTQLCDGLQHAHKKGIVHRDIKPSNVVLIDTEDEASVVKIVDFGLAKLMASDEDKQHLTKTGMVMGTPLYMSPEQCRGSELDHRSDIYSVGCVMYAALTGQVPLKGDSTFDTMYKHMQETPAPFGVSAPDLNLPPRLERAVFKSLEKDVANRHQSMAELRQEITEAISTAGTDLVDDRSRTLFSGANPSASSASSKAVPRSQTNVPSMGSVLPPQPRPSNRKPLIIGASISALALAGGVAFFQFQEHQRQEADSLRGLNITADAGNRNTKASQRQSAPSPPLLAFNNQSDAFTPQAAGGMGSSNDVIDARTNRASGGPAGGGGGLAPEPLQKSRLNSQQADADLAPTANKPIVTDARVRLESAPAVGGGAAGGGAAPQPVPKSKAPVPIHTLTESPVRGRLMAQITPDKAPATPAPAAQIAAGVSPLPAAAPQAQAPSLQGATNGTIGPESFESKKNVARTPHPVPAKIVAAPAPPHPVKLKVSPKTPAPLISPTPTTPKKEAPSDREALLARAFEREQKGNLNFNDGAWKTAIPFYEQCLHFREKVFGQSSAELVPVLARVVACSVNARDEQARLKIRLDQAVAIFKKDPKKVLAVVDRDDEPLRIWIPLARGSDSLAQQSQGEIRKSYYGWSADFFALALRYRKGPKNSPECRKLLNELCTALNRADQHPKALQVRKDFDLAVLKELGQGAAQKRQETKEIIQEKMRESAQKREDFFRKGEERRLEQEQPNGHHKLRDLWERKN